MYNTSIYLHETVIADSGLSRINLFQFSTNDKVDTHLLEMQDYEATKYLKLEKKIIIIHRLQFLLHFTIVYA